MAVSPEVRARPEAAPRCGACLGLVLLARLTCPACGATLHHDCRALLRTCPTLGCGTRLGAFEGDRWTARRRARCLDSPEPRAAALRSLVLLLGVAAVALFAAASPRVVAARRPSLPANERALALASLLRSEVPPAVQANALFALTELVDGGEAVEEEILRAAALAGARHDGEVRERALILLERRGAAAARAVEGLLVEGGPEERVAALGLLLDVFGPDHPRSRLLLARASSARSERAPQVRAAACVVLSRLRMSHGDPPWARALARACVRTDPNARLRALAGLIALLDRDWPPRTRLLGHRLKAAVALGEGEDRVWREPTRAVLGEMGRALPLRVLLEDDPDHEVRRAACLVIAWSVPSSPWWRRSVARLMGSKRLDAAARAALSAAYAAFPPKPRLPWTVTRHVCTGCLCTCGPSATRSGEILSLARAR